MNTQPTTEKKCADKVTRACEGRLNDIRIMLDPQRSDFELADNGTLDTLIVADYHEFIFSDTSSYRDESGKFDMEYFLDDEFDNFRESLRDEFNAYGLCFDYVEPETFTEQLEGYWRFQISYGGPSEEIRFYYSAGASRPYRIEFWYLDWFDGAPEDITEDLTARLVWEYFEPTWDTGA